MLMPQISPGTLFSKSQQAFQLTPYHRRAIQASRYYDGTAYFPGYGRAFQHPYTEWDEAAKGPRPIIRPLPSRLVEIGSQFLFSMAPKFVFEDKLKGVDDNVKSSPLQELLNDILEMNEFSDMLLPEARAAAIDGGTVFKFAWTPQIADRQISIQTVNAHDTTWFRDDLDSSIVNMVRLQFKYVDNDGNYWMYREDWTNTTYKIYLKLKTTEADDSSIFTQFVKGEWPSSTYVNSMGVIPFTYIYNKKQKGDTNGFGDYWNLFSLFDNFNHTAWLEHHSNQQDGDPITAIMNASIDGVLEPGAVIQLIGENANIIRLNAGNGLRDPIRQYKLDARQEIFDAAGYDDIDPAAITNKGNLTRAVWEMVYSKTLKTTNEKRKHWGKSGLCRFFGNLLIGLSRLDDARSIYPALTAVDEKDYHSYTPVVQWPELFQITGEERSAIISDSLISIENGFLPRKRATEAVAAAWGIEDTEALLEEVADVHVQLQNVQDANAKSTIDLANNPPKSVVIGK